MQEKKRREVNLGDREKIARPQIIAVNTISIRGCRLCPLAPPPGFSDFPTALMQQKKRREVNVGNNRDVHQVSMHSGRTRQKLICPRLQLQCITCSKMPKPVHTAVHQWFLQLTNLWGELAVYFWFIFVCSCSYNCSLKIDIMAFLFDRMLQCTRGPKKTFFVVMYNFFSALFFTFRVDFYRFTGYCLN